MLSLSKTNDIGFLEPSGLASGVFACVTPAITSRGSYFYCIPASLA